ncbi:NHL repeat-containing protein [Mucilaginibacter gotjawali]|uniref:Serine/threonine-protein kinase PknD n=2 Tax=Mucilaginibacter gotjawali TaxID=1550579 RepID=A0A110B287_9SPHI|nr:NHL repeat-containing protein [Mucilaginibacter gotjawali]MBB3055524.1 sugar lactone lactonase YvrE [Mucilaginibacter gotjawali]BAU53196.1 Serine/threonine-protein kinase PknD [Mucilaginibacter gotjawali]
MLLLIACFTTACKKDFLRQNHFNTNPDTTKTDSLAALDSLPSFNNPSGVAIDASGNIYVADYGNNLIRKIAPGGIVTTLAGSGNAGYIDGAGTLASFTQPTGLTVDASGNLFVADAGDNLIREISPAGVVTTIAGSDTTGSGNGIGTASSFFGPLGVAVDAHDNIYVADAGNNLIRLIGQGGQVSTFAGTLNTGTSTNLSPFNNPSGVALDGSGNVFVANYLNSTIMKITPSGVVSTYAGVDTLKGANNGPAALATFYYPNSVAADAAGNIYVSDGVNNLIRKITPDGTVSTLAGSGLAGSADSTGTKASFNYPAGLAVDAAGNVYVADSNNNLIRKITPAGVVSTVAGSGLQGATNGTAVARKNRKLLVKKPMQPRLNVFYRGGTK